MSRSLIDVENLRVQFRTPGGIARVVNDVSFSVAPRETLAIVGESGCGKSVTSLSMMGLLSDRNCRTAGSIRLRGRNILGLPETELRKIRGNTISMIFQEPMTSLNPVMTVGRQIGEPLRQHRRMPPDKVRVQVLELLTLVGITDPGRRIDEYPHQLSGGMRQRVMIAMALACNPQVLIADEPTTALDVTVQAQILDLMSDLKARVGAAVIIITHDLGVVAEVAERVIVMYAGRIVEQARVRDLFARPLHPYTRGLMSAVPRIGASRGGGRGRLTEIPGLVPDLKADIIGCSFAGRCPMATDVCRQVEPTLEGQRGSHAVACHHVDQEDAIA